MDLYQRLFNRFGYNNPFFTVEVKEELNGTKEAENKNISDAAVRMRLKRLADEEKIVRYANGIYFIPKPSQFIKQTISIEQIINRKYLLDEVNEEVIGYKTGIQFANQMRLTTQTASVFNIVTNIETNAKRKKELNDWTIILRKPVVPVNKSNQKLLQVLDLLKNYNEISELPLLECINRLKEYLSDVKISQKEYEQIIMKYPKKTIILAYESGLKNEVTS